MGKISFGAISYILLKQHDVNNDGGAGMEGTVNKLKLLFRHEEEGVEEVVCVLCVCSV